MAQTLLSPTLDSLVDGFSQDASSIPDPRRGFNEQFAVADAAACAVVPFFLRDPLLLYFQHRMLHEDACSNCQSLFGVECIPTDN